MQLPITSTSTQKTDSDALESFEFDCVPLFYEGFEAKARDHLLGGAYSWGHGSLRHVYRTLRKKQPFTGYYTAFLNLKRSLETIGLKVRVNDFSYARKNPQQPIGISGYPGVFEQVRLPNPAVFGPGFVPPPDEIKKTIANNNLRVVTLPSEWPCEIWRETLGDQVQPFFVGIDLEKWPDLSDQRKTVDVVVYEKIRWNNEEREKDLLQPLLDSLKKRNLNVIHLKYGHHHLSEFRSSLAQTTSMIFVCEHETQGLAYQEAMASGVPVLAWDDGVLVDPYQSSLAPDGLVVSSVPYFDDRCGAKFKKGAFDESFDAFWEALPNYRPREYVSEALSLEASGRRYVELLRQTMRK